LIGGAIRAVFVLPFQGKKFHIGRAIHQAMSVGVEALPITSLISFFVGTILAVNAAYELRKLGALHFVASGVAIAITRELGPLMTAIVVIGRSGSAFAAEIGTMKVNEEIDAMETMALEPGSPAIDHGTNEGCPQTDQRGAPRPQPPGGICDIGAVEFGALADLGVHLLRAGRRRDAQEPLRRALDLAQRTGAAPLAERARRELLATGARPRRSAVTGPDALTSAERQVAGLAADGLSNRQIAQHLFITQATVETHLRHAFQKLGISARGDLKAQLAS